MGSCWSLKRASYVGVLGAALALSACTDDGAALHVICNIKPEIDDDSCIFDPESEACVFEGALNLAAATHYAGALRVESGLTARASNSPPRPEPNRLNLTGGEVELRKTNGAPIKFRGLKNPFPFVGSGSVLPGEAGFMSVTLIPDDYVDQLRENSQGDQPLDQILLAVKVKGITDGQVEVTSGEWIWPIRLDYRSPAISDGQCTQGLAVCVGLEGVDDAGGACLCETPDQGCVL